MKKTIGILTLAIAIIWSTGTCFASPEKVLKFEQAFDPSDHETFGYLGFCYDGYPNANSALKVRDFFEKFFTGKKIGLEGKVLFEKGAGNFGFAINIDGEASKVITTYITLPSSDLATTKYANALYSFFEKNGANIILLEKLPRQKKESFCRFFMTAESCVKVPEIHDKLFFNKKDGFSKEMTLKIFESLSGYVAAHFAKKNLQFKVIGTNTHSLGKPFYEFDPNFGYQPCDLTAHFYGEKWPSGLIHYYRLNTCYDQESANQNLAKLVQILKKSGATIIYSNIVNYTTLTYKGIIPQQDEKGEVIHNFSPVIFADVRLPKLPRNWTYPEEPLY